MYKSKFDTKYNHCVDIYRPQRSWGKVIFSEACVKRGVCQAGRGGVQADTTLGRHPPQSRHPQADTPPEEADTPRKQTPPGQTPTGNRHPREADTHGGCLGRQPPRQTPPPRSRHPREQCMLGDTGNKRAVRILLECILV